MFLAIVSSVGAQELKFRHELPSDTQFAKRTIRFSPDTNGDLQADVYRPAGAKGRLPIFLFMNAVGKQLGPVLFRDHPQYAGWGRAATLVGVAGIVMESDGKNSLQNFDQLIGYLQKNAEQLGVDADQVIVFSCSANVKIGMPVITDPRRAYIRGGVVYYGNGEVGSFRHDVPVLVVRAGMDAESLNRGLDEVVARAVNENAPWTLINISGGNHGFDVFDDNEESREVISQTLAFVKRAVDPKFRQALLARQQKAQASGLAYAKKFPEAATAYQQLLAANPKDDVAHWKLAQVLAQQGQHRQAIEHFQAALDLGNMNRGFISMAAAKSAMAIEDRDTALNFIERLKGIDVITSQLMSIPEFEPLHGDPRFQAVVTTARGK